MWSYKTYLACFAGAAALAAVLVPLAARAGLRLGLVDRPDLLRRKGRAVPRSGGLAVLVAAWAPVLVVPWLGNLVGARLHGATAELALLLLAGLAAAAVGTYDDARGATPAQKLAAEAAVAVALFLLGVRVERLGVPWVGEVVLPAGASFLVTTLWIVGVTNALNLIDGLDGLAAGVGALASISTGVVAALAGDAFLATTLLSLAGALCGFLIHNATPGRVYLGDGGSLFLGMTLAVAALLAQYKTQTALSLAVPLAILGYPLLDTSLTVVRRWRRGRPLLASDLQHLHYRLVAAGLSRPHAVLGICVGSGLGCLAALGLALERRSISLPAAGLALVLALFGLRRAGVAALWVRTTAAERAALAEFRRRLVEVASDVQGGARLADVERRLEGVAAVLAEPVAQGAPGAVDLGALAPGSPLARPDAARADLRLVVAPRAGTSAFREEALNDLRLLADVVATARERAGGGAPDEASRPVAGPGEGARVDAAAPERS